MTIQPQGEEIRRAVKWISEQRIENPGMSLNRLIESACIKFNLSPKDEEFLTRFVREKQSEGN